MPLTQKHRTRTLYQEIVQGQCTSLPDKKATYKDTDILQRSCTIKALDRRTLYIITTHSVFELCTAERHHTKVLQEDIVQGYLTKKKKQRTRVRILHSGSTRQKSHTVLEKKVLHIISRRTGLEPRV